MHRSGPRGIGRPGSVDRVAGRGNVIKASFGDTEPTLPNIPTQAGLDAKRFEARTIPADVDLLVSLPSDKTGLALGALLMEVQDLLHRRVEVITERSLHPALRDRVLREAQPL